MLSWMPWLTLAPWIIVPVLLFLFRTWIVARIARSVQHQFDTRIEEVRSDFRTREEQIKSSLRDSEAEIASLRTSAFSGSAARQALLDKRRFEAVEKIWTAVNESAQLKLLSNMMATLNYDAIAKISGQRNIQQFVDTFGKIAPDPKLLKNAARDERPFVPEIVWAYYSAYTTVLSFSFVRFQALKYQIPDPQKLVSADSVKTLLKSALPHQAAFIDKYDAGAYHYLLEELESKLLWELRKVLDGKDADQASVERAAEMLAAVKSIKTDQIEEEAAVAARTAEK